MNKARDEMEESFQRHYPGPVVDKKVTYDLLHNTFRSGWYAHVQAETQKHKDDIAFDGWVKTWEVEPSPASQYALEQAWRAALAYERGKR